jgi:uncharacterized protein YbaP (TraB family)
MYTIPTDIRRQATRNSRCFAPVILIILTLFVLSSANPAAAESLLWEVKSPTATVFLFGSIHLAKSDLYPLDAAIEDSFAKSSNLVLELNPLTVDQMKLQQEILAKAMYDGDKTIKDDLSEEVYGMLEEYLKKEGLPVEGFIKLKPAMLSITISSLKLIKEGFSPDQGIDIYFAKKAGKDKPILELETVQQQMDMIFNLPDPNLFLKYTLVDSSKTGGQVDEIIKLWKAGDAGKINEVIIDTTLKEYPELSPILDAILFQRNG